MKVILGYTAISANGMIAKKDDDTNWISKEEWDGFGAMVRKAGNLIVGHRTYNILTKQEDYVQIKDIRLVAVAHEDFLLVDPRHKIAHSPKEAIELLKDFQEIIVCGGGTLNAAFLVENLVDEIYLDIEPILIGEGIPLFQGKDFVRNLKLLGHKKISKNEIRLHYQVLKHG